MTSQIQLKINLLLMNISISTKASTTIQIYPYLCYNANKLGSRTNIKPKPSMISHLTSSNQVLMWAMLCTCGSIHLTCTIHTCNSSNRTLNKHQNNKLKHHIIKNKLATANHQYDRYLKDKLYFLLNGIT